MALTRLRRKVLGRRSVRARIALACAGLFLVTGAVFVAATYALVDHSLGSTNSITNDALYRTCNTAKINGSLEFDQALQAECHRAFAGGARLGASNQRARDLHELLLWSLVGLGVATIVAGVLGWAIGRRILLPLHRVTAAARRATQEHLDERISLAGPDDELKELATTFDDMLNRLELAFASQRRFVANASHELRTPLTSMRTLIDVAMAKPTRTTGQLEVLVGGVRDALDQSEALIDGLLTLARSDRGVTTHELADLEAAAQDAIDQVSAAARQSNVAIEADLSPSPAVGDRLLLDRLVVNLLDNAVRHNVTGGSVTVVTGSENGASYVTVTNTGRLVPESAVMSLVEPFTRLDARVNNGKGVGLGLSIVNAITIAHHAHLTIRPGNDGGLEVHVCFPPVGLHRDRQQSVQDRTSRSDRARVGERAANRDPMDTNAGLRRAAP